MRLLLLRHGQTVDNVAGALGTAPPGPGLTALGEQQARSVPDGLEALIRASEQGRPSFRGGSGSRGSEGGHGIQAIYASALLRTQLTASPLSEALGLGIQVVEGIGEIHAGELEGRSDEDAVRGYIGPIIAWQHDLDARIPGGESGREFYARFGTAMDALASRHDGTIAIFSHGAAIRAWTAAVVPEMDAEFMRSHALANTGLVVLDGAAGHWSLTRWLADPVGGASAGVDAYDPTGQAG